MMSSDECVHLRKSICDTEYCHQRNLLPATSHHHQRKVLFCIPIGNKHTHSTPKSYIIKNLFIFAFALNHIFLTYLCCFMSHVSAIQFVPE